MKSLLDDDEITEAKKPYKEYYKEQPESYYERERRYWIKFLLVCLYFVIGSLILTIAIWSYLL